MHFGILLTGKRYLNASKTNTRFTFMIKFLPLIFALITFSIKAQNPNSIEPIIMSGLKLIDDIEKKYESSTTVIKADFDFAHDDNFTYVDLSSDFEYVIAALGDDMVASISIILKRKVKNKWVDLDQDSSNTNNASITFNPDISGQYAVDVKVNSFKSVSQVGHVGCFVIAIKK